MGLLYVQSNAVYSLYRDRHGDEVYLAHGPGLRRLVLFDNLDLRRSWVEFVNSHRSGDLRELWLTQLRNTTTDPEAVDEIVWCVACAQPMDPNDDDANATSEGPACDPCIDAYFTDCARCEGSVRQTTTTLNDDEVCRSCLDDHYSYCSHCGGWYRDEHSDSHDHASGACCESPEQEFTVRNDGEPSLSNDERVTVTLPAGLISTEGLNEIYRYLRDTAYGITDRDEKCRFYALAADVHNGELGAAWQTRQGNFTKRLSRHAYKVHALKLTPDVVSHVGCIARGQSTAVDFHLEVTRNLNLSADAFSNDGSCWWGSYSESRCALKTNGGYGLRSFDDQGYLSGRAWVMPLKRSESGALQATFNTHADAFVVFNGYEALSGYVPARIVAHMAGMTYRKVNFSCTPMYVNGDSGYLVAPEEIADPYTDGHLTLRLQQHSDLFETERKELVNVA